MYTIGSLADLISGKNTPNKPQVEVKEIEAKPSKVFSPRIKPDSSTKEQKTPKSERTPDKFTKGKRPNKHPFNKQTDRNEPKNKRFKTNEETEEKTPEKSVSVNAKNAIKRMRDRKKELHADPEKDKRTIFVGNLPISTKKKNLLKYFSKYGKVDSLRFRSVARASLNVPKKTAFITKQFHPNATTVNAYIVFEDEDCCKRSLEANGQIFKENHLRVDLVTSKEHNMKKAIFVGNIPFDAKDEDMWQIFEDCGKIESVRIVRDGLTSVGKGYGYVNFESSDSVELALQMTDVKIRNRELRIQRANATPKNSNKRNEKGEKLRKVPRKPKVQTERVTESNEETENDNNENTEIEPKKKKSTATSFQGTKFTDKQKKKKVNKGELKKKKISKILAKKT